MLEELEKWSHLKQQVLPFDFWKEEEAERQERIHNLPYYEHPETDNQRLFNLQKEYFEGRESALTETFELLLKIAPRLLNVEINHSDGKRRFTQAVIDSMALDAVCLFIEQIKKNRLIIEKSFVAYLRLQVLKVLNGRTKADMFEAYCIKNKLCIFNMSEEEKKNVKLRFELELRRKTMTEQERWEMMREAQILKSVLPTLSEKEQDVERQVFKQKWYGYSLEEVERMGV